MALWPAFGMSEKDTRLVPVDSGCLLSEFGWRLTLNGRRPAVNIYRLERKDLEI